MENKITWVAFYELSEIYIAPLNIIWFLFASAIAYQDFHYLNIINILLCFLDVFLFDLAVNIADDYFKAKKQGGTLESDIEAKDKEMYDLKHELISVQIKLENAEKAMDKLKEENKELQMKIVQLETEIKNNRKK